MTHISPQEFENRKKIFDNAYFYLMDRTMSHPTVYETCIYMQLMLGEDSEEMLKFVLEMERMKDV